MIIFELDKYESELGTIIIMDIDRRIMEFVKNSRYSVYEDTLSESKQANVKIVFDDYLSSVAKK